MVSSPYFSYLMHKCLVSGAAKLETMVQEKCNKNEAGTNVYEFDERRSDYQSAGGEGGGQRPLVVEKFSRCSEKFFDATCTHTTKPGRIDPRTTTTTIFIPSFASTLPSSLAIFQRCNFSTRSLFNSPTHSFPFTRVSLFFESKKSSARLMGKII